MESRRTKKALRVKSSERPATLKVPKFFKEETSENRGKPSANEAEADLSWLQGICLQLGIGSSGYLKQNEFRTVCSQIGLGKIKKKELVNLFKRMDTNKDGLISLPELLSGLSQTSFTHSSLVTQKNKSEMSSSAQTQSCDSLPDSETDELETSLYISTPTQSSTRGAVCLFSGVKHNHDGWAEADNIIAFLDRLEVINGTDVFLSLGLDLHGKVNLADLTAAFDNALTNHCAPDPVCTVAFICYQLEVKHLKSQMEQSREENRKLRLDLSEASARTALLAQEANERHAQLDKSWESKLLDTLGNIKDTFQTVDKKYQDQVKALQSELERERETAAAELSWLKNHLEGVQNRATQEEKQFNDKLTRSQKEIAEREKALAESSEKLLMLKRKNENLKKGIENKIQHAEFHALEDILVQEQKLAKIQEENKILKDKNHELILKLEKAQQKLESTERNGPASNGMVESFAETSELHRDDINFNQELGHHLPQQQVELEWKEIAQRYKSEINSLEDRHNAEMKRMHSQFEQEKQCMLKEQKAMNEIHLAKQLNQAQTTFATEKYHFFQKYESEKNNMKNIHEEEMKALQKRLLKAGSHHVDYIQMQHSIQSLEAQLVKCRDDLLDLEKQKSDLHAQLQQQETTLRCEFEKERKSLAEEFTFKCEQQQIIHNLQLEKLFYKGIDSLPGKLRDDFYSLVQAYAKKDIKQSQTAMLDQLQRDRNGIFTAFEQEKTQMYEKANSERKALVTEYETQLAALQTELSQAHAQLEVQKQVLSEIALKGVRGSDNDESVNAVENLRRKMEGELVIELNRIKESFELEKKELEKQKARLEKQLSYMKKLLVAEREKTVETISLMEAMKTLQTENKEMQIILEKMKVKLHQAHQQINLEQADAEVRLQAVRDEGESKGRMEGLNQGQEEGRAQGRKEGNEEGFARGRSEGYESGYTQCKKDVETLLESMKQEKTILENRLSWEKEKNSKFFLQIQELEKIKTSYDLLLGEKNALESKYKESLDTLVGQHQVEKEYFMRNMEHLETQKSVFQSDKKAMESQIDAIHQQLEQVKQEVHKTITSPEMKAQNVMSNEERQKMQAILDQTSDQLVKAITFLVLAQSKLLEELELMKQKARSIAEVENYTKVQISVVEHQQVITTLQNTTKERESLIDMVIKEADTESKHTMYIMEATVKDIQNKLDSSHEELIKQKEVYRQLHAKSNHLTLVLKDLYVENSHLMKVLADREVKKRQSEHLVSKLMGKCETYKRTIEKVCDNVSKNSFYCNNQDV